MTENKTNSISMSMLVLLSFIFGIVLGVPSYFYMEHLDHQDEERETARREQMDKVVIKAIDAGVWDFQLYDEKMSADYHAHLRFFAEQAYRDHIGLQQKNLKLMLAAAAGDVKTPELKPAIQRYNTAVASYYDFSFKTIQFAAMEKENPELQCAYAPVIAAGGDAKQEASLVATVKRFEKLVRSETKNLRFTDKCLPSPYISSIEYSIDPALKVRSVPFGTSPQEAM